MVQNDDFEYLVATTKARDTNHRSSSTNRRLNIEPVRILGVEQIQLGCNQFVERIPISGHMDLIAHSNLFALLEAVNTSNPNGGH